MEPNLGSVLAIFVGAPVAIAAMVTLLVLWLSSPSRQPPGISAASSEHEAFLADVRDSPKTDVEDSEPDSTEHQEEPSDGGTAAPERGGER